MQKEQPTKIDIVKIQMVRDGTLDYGKKAIKGPQDLAELGQKVIQNSDREVFLLVCLNTRNHINCIHVVSIGTVNTSLVAVREVLKAAILSNATAMAFVHNHPSGDVEPSEDDVRVTQRIAECGELFDIKLLDHVIVSDDGRYESLLERGLIIRESKPHLLGVTDNQLQTEGKQDIEEIQCEECGTTYIIKMLKEGNEYGYFGQRYCPFCGHMTLEW